jgi:hypothetical protein
MPRELEERAKEFVDISEDGKVSVNWEGLAQEKRSVSYGASARAFDHMMDNIWDVLYDKEVVVCEGTPGSFFATGSKVPLNPSQSETIMGYSFAPDHEKDARAYYAHFFRDALYAVILHQTVGAVEKAEKPKQPVPE